MSGSVIEKKMETTPVVKPIWNAREVDISLVNDEVVVKFNPVQQNGLSNRIREALEAVVKPEADRLRGSHK